MRREHFYRNKKAVKRSAAGAALAIFLALQITGCSQTADQNKADRKTEQAQGTEKEGTAAEESSAETEKNGTGTDKPKDTGNNESGQEKTREGGEAGEAAGPWAGCAAVLHIHEVTGMEDRNMKTFDLMLSTAVFIVYLYNAIMAIKCHQKKEKVDAVYYLVWAMIMYM